MKATFAYLEQEVGRSLVEALTEVLGEPPTTGTASTLSVPDESLWFQLTFHPATVGRLSIGFDASGAADLEAALLKGSHEDHGTGPSTLTATLSKTAGIFAAAMAAILKQDVSAGPIEDIKPAQEAIKLVLKLSVQPDLHLLVACCPDATLIDSLEPHALRLLSANAAFQIDQTPQASNNLELLLDVELPVSISFGRAQLPLKDVIKLTTGSIVELNRSVSEPVDIIVNNCIVARGEVVVVEGNFGVRIKQVISKQDRLRTLG